MTDWRIDVGRYQGGDRIVLPVPGWKGAHWLAGGSSNAGKTSLLRLAVCRMALDFGDRIAFAVIDPHSVGFQKLAPRTSFVAYGWANAPKALQIIKAEMQRRLRVMFAEDIEEWTPDAADVIGPYLVVVMDELAAITGLPKPARGQAPQTVVADLAQQLRKTGGGLMLGCNSPKAGLIGAPILENCPIRVCLRTKTVEQTEAILESRRWPAHDSEHPNGIGLDEPGGCFVDDGYQVRRGRTTGVSPEAVARIVEKTRYDTPDLGWDERVLYPYERT